MFSKIRSTRLGLFTVLAALSLTVSASAALFSIYSPSIVKFSTGKSYSTHAADWNKWALKQTAAKSAVLDTTGVNCAEGQTGNIWFLAGFNPQLTPVASVTRKCTIPLLKTIVLPIANAGYGVFPEDPADQQGEAFARSQVEWIKDVTDLKLTIDGQAVTGLNAYFERSDAFNIKLGASNMFTPAYGLGEQQLAPFVDAGYYVAITGLTLIPFTKHTITFGGAGISTTYNITVGL